LAETVLNVGSKTISHASSVTERILPLLKKYFVTMEDQLELIQIISEFWTYNIQNFEISIKIYLGFQLISKEALVNYITKALRNAVDSTMPFDQIARKILRFPIIDLINDYKTAPFPIKLEEVFSGILVDSEVSERIQHFFATLY
jgi:hypothetical protein